VIPYQRTTQEHIIEAVLVYGWFTEGFDTRDLKEAKRFASSPAIH
jgi:hypothetical protein